MPKKGYKDIKEEVIIKRTKRSFTDWRKILDKFNAQKNGRKAAVAFLVEAYKINSWWAQVIAIRYEYEKKLNLKK
ncbi:MAG: hypothetical protein A2358_03375 [Candidatus Staskawiczbacteria bacterium RIFOXYB1_FULL_37_44]|uniref:Uncharacterized protein n=1 Tax=Candidatus Staskawiczbacteria bacterium RIFOXYB1_FULL_37_44 TaxID=1802223 RepID=A0A1G2IW09_9BACT|nr:MAG: hypothetical protein A2358_03375 [Candidatus Staskawiczbacteria bacterium RIFOXYB1_FULL_37_44]